MGWWWRKRNKKPTLEKQTLEKQTLERGAKLLKDLIEFGHGISNPIKFFSADEILKATNNFSDSNCVSRFDYPFNWYSGKNENHPMILIKKEVRWRSLLRVDHSCRDIAVSSMELYPVEISEQPWKRRMKIAQDIATALAYLHTAFPRPFVYRSLNIGNVLLDEDGVAKLNDFSYCVSIPEGETFVKVDETDGLYRYLDPGGVVSEKTDVFAFGMFMGLRLLLGERSFWELYHLEEEEREGGGSDTDYLSRKNIRLQNFMSKLKEDRRIEEIADPEMIEKMGHISEQELCQMKAFRMLLRRCIGPSEEVPTMVEVAKELKKIQRFLYNDSSSPLGETHLDSPQDISSSLVLSNQT